MIIGYDARPIVLRWTGMRTYTVNLVQELLRLDQDCQILLYFHEGEPDVAIPFSQRLKWRKVTAVNGWWWTLFQVAGAIRHDGTQLFHADYIVPPFAPCQTVVTMHDAISAMFVEPADVKTRLVTNSLSFLSVHRSKFVLVPSESAKKDVARSFKVAPRKIVVAPYGVSEIFRPLPKKVSSEVVAKRFGITGRFILTVNFFRPRKNAPVLAAAFRELCRRRVPVDWLVFAGAAPENLKHRLLQIAADAADRIIFTGYVPDQDLPFLYAAASVFAFPSRYEGFGLPVLEAMACGTPVVAGDAPAVNEFARPAALLVPPDDWIALADALERVLTDKELTEILRQKGLQLVGNFTWQRTAQLTLNVYKRALSQR